MPALTKWPTFFTAVCSQKGGTSKTTTAVHIAHGMLRELNEARGLDDARVVVVDLDPQGDLTNWLGRAAYSDHWIAQMTALHSMEVPYIVPRLERPTFAQLVQLWANAVRPFTDAELVTFWSKAVEPVADIDGLFLVGMDEHAITIVQELERAHATYKAYAKELAQGAQLSPSAQAVLQRKVASPAEIIAEVMTSLNGRFDVVVFDCPPAISHYVDAAMRVVHRVVIPMLADQKSLHAALQTRQSMQDARRVNPKLDIGAVIIAADNRDTVISKDFIWPTARDVFGPYLFPKLFHQRVAVRELDVADESRVRGATLFDGDEYHSVATAYTGLSQLLLRQHEALTRALTRRDTKVVPRPAIGEFLVPVGGFGDGVDEHVTPAPSDNSEAAGLESAGVLMTIESTENLTAPAGVESIGDHDLLLDGESAGPAVPPGALPVGDSPVPVPGSPLSAMVTA